MNELNTVLFDFDGTLADTRQALLQVYRRLAAKYNFPEWPKEKLEELWRLPILERLNKAGVPLSLLPRLARETRAIVSEFMHQAAPYPGVHDMLTSLVDKGFRIYILSSNSEQNIRTFLNDHGMTDIFKKIHTAKNLLGKHAAIRSFLIRNRIKRTEAVYVGDELRDIAACKKVPIRVIAVSWGYDVLSLLRQGRPDAIANSPSDILPIIESGFADGMSSG